MTAKSFAEAVEASLKLALRDPELLRIVDADRKMAEAGMAGERDRGSDTLDYAAMFRWIAAYRHFPELTDPKRVYEALKELANTQGLAGVVNPDIVGDPGRILLEMFAAVHSALGVHLAQQFDSLLDQMLQVSGHHRRPPHPANVVLRLSEDGCCFPRTATHRDKARILDFRPVLPALLLRQSEGANGDLAVRPVSEDGRGDGNGTPSRTWTFSVSGDVCRQFFEGQSDRPGIVMWIRSDHDGRDAILKCGLFSRWQLSVNDGDPVDMRVTPLVDAMLERTAQPPGDNADDDGFLRVSSTLRVSPTWVVSAEHATRHWLVLHPIDGPPSGRQLLKDPASVCLTCTPLEIPSIGGNDDPGHSWLDQVRFDSLPFVNWQDNGADEDADIDCDFFPRPRGTCVGAAANGLGPGTDGWTLHCNSGAKLEAEAATHSSGGRDAETDDEFYRRGPHSLRRRRIPHASYDWQRLIFDIDPSGRVADARARDGQIYVDSQKAWTRGVQIAFHMYGEAEVAASMASNFVRVAEKLLDTVRPIGTNFAVLAPTLVPGALELFVVPEAATSVSFERLRDELFLQLTLDTQHLRDVGKKSPPPNTFWRFLLDSFRSPVRRHYSLSDLLRSYLSSTEVQQSLVSATRFAGWEGQETIRFQPDQAISGLEANFPYRERWLVPYVRSRRSIRFPNQLGTR